MIMSYTYSALSKLRLFLRFKNKLFSDLIHFIRLLRPSCGLLQKWAFFQQQYTLPLILQVVLFGPVLWFLGVIQD